MLFHSSIFNKIFLQNKNWALLIECLEISLDIFEIVDSYKEEQDILIVCLKCIFRIILLINERLIYMESIKHMYFCVKCVVLFNIASYFLI